MKIVPVWVSNIVVPQPGGGLVFGGFAMHSGGFGFSICWYLPAPDGPQATVHIVSAISQSARIRMTQSVPRTRAAKRRKGARSLISGRTDPRCRANATDMAK